MGGAQCLGEKSIPPQTEKNTFKVLCLGVGGCGKTTFVKQMKIIHHIPWDNVELDNFISIIRGNLIAGLQDVIQLAITLEKKFSKKIKKDVDTLLELRPRKVDLVTDEDARKLLLKVWNDSLVQDLIKNQPEQLQVSHMDYFFEMFDQICSPDYQPTDEHILRCRQRTTGSYHTTIYLKKTYFEFHDVGGQRPERAKWELVLKDHNYVSVLYFVAADEFDTHSLLEKEFNDTKMEISRHIWNELINSDVIPKSTITFLFINRTDLFEKRIKTEAGFNSFKKTFPKYRGTDNPQQCLEVIKDLYLNSIKDKTKKPLCHFTSCLDTSMMEVVWNTLHNEVIRSTLQSYGI